MTTPNQQHEAPARIAIHPQTVRLGHGHLYPIKDAEPGDIIYARVDPPVAPTGEYDHEDPRHIYHTVFNPSGCDKFYCLHRFDPEPVASTARHEAPARYWVELKTQHAFKVKPDPHIETVEYLRHPRYAHQDDQRLQDLLDSLPEVPTEEQAEEVLQACGSSGKEVVNGFIDRLLRDNLELKQKLAARVDPPAAPAEAQEIVDLWRQAYGRRGRGLTWQGGDRPKDWPPAYRDLTTRIAAALATVRQEVESRMRSACVEKVKAQLADVIAKAEHAHYTELADLNPRREELELAITNLESLTLDQQQEKQS